MTSASLIIDGRKCTIDVPPSETLLDTLRVRLSMTATKSGCLVGYCGACTVLLDGLPVHACCVLTVACHERHVETAASDRPELQRVQESLVATGAVQCGYCIPGFAVAIVGHLMNRPEGSEPCVPDELLLSNICRCTGFVKLRDAVGALCDGAVESEVNGDQT